MPLFEVTLSGVRTQRRLYSATVEVEAENEEQAQILAREEAPDWQYERVDGDDEMEEIMVGDVTAL